MNEKNHTDGMHIYVIWFGSNGNAMHKYDKLGAKSVIRRYSNSDCQLMFSFS